MDIPESDGVRGDMEDGARQVGSSWDHYSGFGLGRLRVTLIIIACY